MGGRAGVKGLGIIAALVSLAIAYAAADDGNGIPRWFRHRDRLERADARIGVLESRIEALRREVAQLESGGFAIERAIREDLRLARVDEVIVRIPDPDSTNHRFR
jgi:cell division protein FtsB